MAVSWDASPTAARYEVKLLQTAPTEKVASVAVVEDDGSDSFTKTFNNLIPGRYSVSIDRELGWRLDGSGGWPLAGRGAAEGLMSCGARLQLHCR